MYSRILVAVDGSEISILAMQEAIRFAKNQHAKLCILYVANEFIPSAEEVYVNFKNHEANMRKQGKAVLNKMINLAHKSHKEVESRLIEITESEHRVSDIILNEANGWQADLIILGTHGRTGIPRLLLGSVAEEVTRKTKVPVHLVHG